MAVYADGDLVWAKMKGYPHWPARVDDASNDRRMQIFFFGTHETGWLGAKYLLPYAIHKKKYARPLKTSRFLEGLVEIEKNPKVEFEAPSQDERKAPSVARRRPQSLGSAMMSSSKVCLSPSKSPTGALLKHKSFSSLPRQRKADIVSGARLDRGRSQLRRTSASSISELDRHLLSLELSLKESLTIEAPNVHTSVKLLNELNQSSIPYSFLKQYPEFALTIKQACHYRQSVAVVQRAKELFQALQDTALATMDFNQKSLYLHRLHSTSSGVPSTCLHSTSSGVPSTCAEATNDASTTSTTSTTSQSLARDEGTARRHGDDSAQSAAGDDDGDGDGDGDGERRVERLRTAHPQQPDAARSAQSPLQASLCDRHASGVLDDLTNSPKTKDTVLQATGVVNSQEATHHLEAAAKADADAARDSLEQDTRGEDLATECGPPVFPSSDVTSAQELLSGRAHRESPASTPRLLRESPASTPRRLRSSGTSRTSTGFDAGSAKQSPNPPAENKTSIGKQPELFFELY